MAKPILPLRGQFGLDRVRTFEVASDRRFQEAKYLVAGRYHLTAIYLLGYSVELLLKAACFRLDGRKDNEAITDTIRREFSAKALRFREIDPDIVVPRDHEIYQWAKLYVAIRIFRDQQTDRHLLAELLGRVRRIDRHWAPLMRYRSTDVNPDQLREALSAATWIHSIYRKLI